MGAADSRGIPLTTVTACITKSSLALFQLVGTGPITVRGSDPIVSVNGSVVPLGPPVSSLNWSHVVYPLLTSIKPTDVVTYSALAGWAYLASGPAPAAVGAPVANYAGSIEPPFLPAVKSTRVGINLDLGSGAINYGFSSLTANWRLRASDSWAPRDGTCTTNPDGSLRTWKAGTAAVITIANGTIPNQIDGRMMPDPVGVFVLKYDDVAPSTPTVLSLGTSSATCILIAQTPGSLVRGALRGISKTYAVVRVGPNGSWPIGLGLIATGGIPAVIAVRSDEVILVRNGAVNIQVIPPGNYPDAGALAPDQNLVGNLTAPSGRAVAAVRCMGTTIDATGSCMVDATDAPSPTAFRYGTYPVQPGGLSRTLLITVIRPYSAKTSPSILFGDQIIPISLENIPAGTGFMAYGSGASSGWIVAELVTTAPHGLKSGQKVTLGPYGPINALPTTGGTKVNFSQAKNLEVVVTGPTTFALLQYAGTPTVSAIGLEGNIHTLAGTTLINPAIPCTVIVPDAGCVPYEVPTQVVNALPGASYWMNLPHAMTQDFARSVARTLFSPGGLDPSHPLILELANETWNQGAGFFYFMQLGYLNQLNRNAAYLQRSAVLWKVFEDTAATLGWGGQIIRVVGSQAWGVVNTQQLVAEANRSGIRIDAVAIDTYRDAPTDPSFVAAAASAFSGGPWTLAAYHDLLRWDVLLNASYIAAYAAHVVALKAYAVPGSPTPKLVSYEGGIQHPVPNGIGNPKDSRIRPAAVQDVMAHPDAAALVTAWHVAAQNAGFDLACYFQYCGWYGSSAWGLIPWGGMPAGDGTANAFGVQPSGLSCTFLGNNSPALQGFQRLIN